MSKWTRFMVMHSGGHQKLDWSHIYIEAPIEQAKVIFYNRFGLNPDGVTCTCCGSGYSIDESDGIVQATGYDRHCKCTKNGYVDEPVSNRAKTFIPLDEYIKGNDVCFVFERDIKPEERIGSVPEQGYAWID